jgi:hypothetical protein
LPLRLGEVLFSLAIVALGTETIVCARYVGDSLGPRYRVIPVLPWLPAIPWLAYVFGVIIASCGLGLLSKRTARPSALVLGGLLFLCALILDLPKYAADVGNMSLRTTVFESLSLATLAWLFPVSGVRPVWLTRGSRYVLGLSLIVFGMDHIIGLVPLASLVPAWIPWRVFWIGFFGAGFIAAGLSIGCNFLLRWGAYGLGLMFGLWVFTLHLPRTVLGLSGGAGPHNPNEWESLFIAIALWGGPWALARTADVQKLPFWRVSSLTPSQKVEGER